MNKKGFTLIELLATILILSLLMMVAVPNIMSTIDKNKKSTYVEDAKKMITLAEYKIRSDTSIELPLNGKCIVVKLSSLDLSEFEEGPEGGTYDLNNSYVVIARSGETYLYYVTIVENYDGTTRGIPIISRDDLEKESAKNEVKSNTELTVITPNVNSNIKGYTITKIIE